MAANITRSRIVVTFSQGKEDAPFTAKNAAEEWCRNRGISVGSSCVSNPIGLLYGDFTIAKFRNLTQEEIDGLDGTMFGDLRNGPVTIDVRSDAP